MAFSSKRLDRFQKNGNEFFSELSVIKINVCVNFELFHDGRPRDAMLQNFVGFRSL